MTDAGFFRGTSAEQDNRFSDKDKKLLKQMRFPDHIMTKVDMSKVNLEVLKPWISSRIYELLGMEDDVLTEFVFNQLEADNFPDARRIQINLTGFLNGKNARTFTGELWEMMISAQESPNGIPTALLEAKKDEIKFRTEEDKLDQIRNTVKGFTDKLKKEATPPPSRRDRSRSRSKDRSRFSDLPNSGDKSKTRSDGKSSPEPGHKKDSDKSHRSYRPRRSSSGSPDISKSSRDRKTTRKDGRGDLLDEIKADRLKDDRRRDGRDPDRTRDKDRDRDQRDKDRDREREREREREKERDREKEKERERERERAKQKERERKRSRSPVPTRRRSRSRSPRSKSPIASKTRSDREKEKLREKDRIDNRISLEKNEKRKRSGSQDKESAPSKLSREKENSESGDNSSNSDSEEDNGKKRKAESESENDDDGKKKKKKEKKHKKHKKHRKSKKAKKSGEEETGANESATAFAASFLKLVEPASPSDDLEKKLREKALASMKKASKVRSSNSSR